MKTFKFAYSFFKKYIWQALFYVFCLLLSVVLTILLIQISKYVLDLVLVPTTTSGDAIARFLQSGALGQVGSGELLKWLCVIFGGLVIFKVIISYIGGLVSQNYGFKYGNTLRGEVQKKMFLMGSYSSTGDVYTMIVWDLLLTAEMFKTQIPQAISYVFYALFAIVMLFLTHWALGVFVVASFPIFAVICWLYLKNTKPYFTKMRSGADKLTTEVSSTISGILDIKTSGYENAHLKLLENRNEKYTNDRKMCTRTSNFYQMLMLVARALFYGGGIIFAGYLAISGQITIGDLSVAVSFIIIALDNTNNTIYKAFQIQKSLVYTKNVADFCQQKTKKQNNKTKQKIEKLEELTSYKLCVESKTGRIFNKLNFKIKAGEKVGFWFKDGEGVHSFVEAITKKLDPVSGGLFINDVDYKEIEIKSFRNLFSYLSPDVFLFNRSIKDNIVMSNEFDEELYKRVVSLVGLDKFTTQYQNKDNEVIQGKPDDFPMLQRQMIGLARAMYRNSEVLLLEKPMQAMSSKTTSRIIKKIADNFDKTIIVATSDVETLKHLDRIYLVEGGQIVAQGTYKELLENEEKN